MRLAQGQRLAAARAAAGYRSARAAALELGWPESSYRAHEGGTRTIGQDDAERYGRAFKVKPAYILFGDGEAPAPADPPRSREPTARIAPEAETLNTGERDVPVYGVSRGGSAGEFYLNGEVVDHVRRLPGIARNKNVFGVYVEGESMVPKFEPGELVYASPSRPPQGGDYVIVELAPTADERAGPAFIKRLVRRSGDRIICEQFNPAGEVEYDRRQVKAIYRIIPLSELAGF